MILFSLYDAAIPRWHREARCNDVDSEPFFAEPPSPGTASDEEWTAATLEAKSICSHCPVRRDCVAWSVQIEREIRLHDREHSLDGVFGGMNRRDRMNAHSAKDPVRWLTREFGRQLRSTGGFARIERLEVGA